jgi:hypothetical protein
MAVNRTSTVTPNAQTAVAYLQSKGWTAAQAQGIVGNLQQESGVNLSINAVGDGGKAYGIAQWVGDRQTNFQKQYGFPIQQASLSQQLEYINFELTQGTERSAGARIRATKTAAEAAVVTDQYYERSDGRSRSQRIAYANTLAGAPGGSLPTPPSSTPPQSTQQESTVEPAGDNTFYQIPGGTSAKNAGAPILNQEPDAIDVSKPLMNILHQYPSYIYGLSLHLLNPTEYNNIIAGNQYFPNRVLVASAGRYNNAPGAKQFIRSPYFADDFYFSNFNMTTVIGTNAVSRNTNAIEFEFTLLEPYGMTLINRLLDQANDPEMQCDNYLDMIYLLQVDFFASNDAGEIVGVIPNITKRFPVKITQMNIKASVQGSEYQIQAVPYNHSAFDQTTVSTPANFEVVAGSVGDFFQNNQTAGQQVPITSFPSAMNGWQNSLSQDNKIAVPDTYDFNIDPAIAESSFSSGKAMSARDTSMTNTNNTNAIRQSNLGNPSSSFSAQARTFSINAGTSVDKVVDYAIRNSDYIQNQIAIPDGVDPLTYAQQKAQNADQPLNWYKIVPTVKVGPYDPVRKIYSRNITYNVRPYTIYNVKSDVAPQGKATQYVKSYNYIYTGKNDDVLDFDISFNTLYYTAQTAYRSALSNIYKSPNSNSQSKNSNNQNTSSYQGADQNSNSVMPMVVKPQVYNAKARATGGGVTAKSVAVADLEDSLMTMSAADMLNVQLKILGDPQFLKQDDCFYSPEALNNTPSGDPRLTPNGSLRTDYGEIYVLLTFRTPVDIDENTGFMNFGPKYRTSVFSGLYRVLTVNSEFQNGQFLQTLNLIRLPNQAAYDYATQDQTGDLQRQNETTSTTSILTGKPVIIDVPPPIPPILSGESTDQKPNQQLIDAANSFAESPLIDRAQRDLIDLNNSIPVTPLTTQNI